MIYPHDPAFPYRRHIWIGVTLASGVLAMVTPGLSGLMRWLAPAIAVWFGGLGYPVGWLPLKVQAALWSGTLPKPISMLCLGAFYVFPIGMLLNLAAFPLMSAELESEGVTLAHLLLMVPVGFGAAAGAHRVYMQHVQQAHARDVRNARA